MKKTKNTVLLGLVLFGFLACSGPRQAPGDASTAAPQEIVSGTLHLDDAVKSQADPLSVVFLMARNERGQIVAVKKLLPPFQWPVAFELSESDAMIEGTELSGKLKLTARLDKDGNANPASSGDILGGTEAEWVKRGDRDIQLRLSELLP